MLSLIKFFSDFPDVKGYTPFGARRNHFARDSYLDWTGQEICLNLFAVVILV
jgi:hypothetical protein